MKLILVIITWALLVSSLPNILPHMFEELLKPFKLEKFAYAISNHMVALVSLLLSYACFILGASDFLVAASAYVALGTLIVGAIGFFSEFLPHFKAYVLNRSNSKIIADLSGTVLCIASCFLYLTVIVLVAAYWKDRFLGMEGALSKATTFLLEN